MPRILFVLVEGDDDERFFEAIVGPLLAQKCYTVKVWQYAQEKPSRVRSLIRSAKSMDAEYMYVSDLHAAPCVSARKGRVARKFGQVVPDDSIVVVANEIEGWYLAGAAESACEELKIPAGIGGTDNITKEQFRQLVPKRLGVIEAMQAILRTYDIELAKGRNVSFRYFCDKWICSSSGT